MSVSNSDSPTRNPVLLIHGIDDTYLVFRQLTVYLENLGWTVHSLDLIPNNGAVGLNRLAEQVALYADRVFSPEQKFDLVGFSMGGIISRYYVQRLGGIDRVQRFVTISSPHHGTRTAYFRPNIGGGQMRPDSLFLQNLNHDVKMLERINFTSIWTPYDLMIVPASSSRMPVGQNIQLPVWTHPWMLIHPLSLETVAEVLTEPIRCDRPLEHNPLPQK